MASSRRQSFSLSPSPCVSRSRLSSTAEFLVVAFVISFVDCSPSSVAGTSSLKHNSIPGYYSQFEQRQSACVDKPLPSRVRNAGVVFTGTVREIHGTQSAVVEVKRVMKGSEIVGQMTLATDDEANSGEKSAVDPGRRLVRVIGLGDRSPACNGRASLHDTWIFFTNRVAADQLCLNSSLMRMSLGNILQVEAVLKGKYVAAITTPRSTAAGPCAFKFCAFGADCIEDPITGTASCQCPTKCDVTSAGMTSSSTTRSPVCGTDDVTYVSECHLRAASCSQQQRIRVRWPGTCEVRDPCAGKMCHFGSRCVASDDGMTAHCECPSETECSSEQQAPVCGDDDVDYPSRCHMTVASCLKKTHIKMKFNGKCDPCEGVQCPSGQMCYRHDDVSTGAVPGVCHCIDDVTTCSDVPFRPVCGNDWQTYPSECVLKVKACQRQDALDIMFAGTCNPDVPAGSECENVKCDFYSTCRVVNDEFEDNSATITDPGTGVRTKCVCPAICPPIDDPVCGTDHLTYDNECELQMMSCRSRQLITVASRGPCEMCQFVHCTNGAICERGSCVCPPSCPSIDDPVCANDSVTYQNECAMLSTACNQRIELVVVHGGECDSTDDDAEQDGGQGELAASGDVDNTLCNNKLCLYGGICQTFKDGRQTCVCHFNCDAVRSPVCGSDGKLYGNECLMAEASCLTQSDINVDPVDRCHGMSSEELCDGAPAVTDNETGVELNCSASAAVSDQQSETTSCPAGTYCHVVADQSRCCPLDDRHKLSDCRATEYGCCRDGVTPALGPDMAGCPEVCRCHQLGSYSASCQPTTGQCSCKHGVGGKRCDRCQPGFWGLPQIADGLTGCLPCRCNSFGSIREDCEQMTGRCVCRGHVTGHKCDVCHDGSAITSAYDCHPVEAGELRSDDWSTSLTLTTEELSTSPSTTSTDRTWDEDEVTTTTEIPHSDSFSVPSFSGRSFLQLTPLIHGHQEIWIEMNFRALYDNGILLYTGQSDNGTGDFMSLAINNGHLEFRYDLGSGMKVLKVKDRVKLGVFHRVTAKRFGRDGVLRLDGGQDVAGVSPGKLLSLNVGMPLYVGYVGNVTDRIMKNIGVGEGFVGCIESLRIASPEINAEYDLKMPGSNDIEMAYGVEDCDVLPCENRECVNGGSCVLNDTSEYYCQCIDGYTGELCENDAKDENDVAF